MVTLPLLVRVTCILRQFSVEKLGGLTKQVLLYSDYKTFSYERNVNSEQLKIKISHLSVLSYWQHVHIHLSHIYANPFVQFYENINVFHVVEIN